MNRTIIAFSLVIFLLTGCSKSSQPTETQIGSDINGKSSAYAPGQRFSLELDVHSDGGYQWFYDISDEAVVKVDSASYMSKSGQQVIGGLSVETIYFHAIGHGQSTISLNERRGWEKDTIPPINTIQFSVLVK
jgi:predicted secreted protein